MSIGMIFTSFFRQFSIEMLVLLKTLFINRESRVFIEKT